MIHVRERRNHHMIKEPPPETVHPFYKDCSHLIDWINEPIPTPVAYVQEEHRQEEDDPLTLVRQRAYAEAPYVGDEYRYAWYYFTDEHERSISGKVVRVYSWESLIEQPDQSSRH